MGAANLLLLSGDKEGYFIFYEEWEKMIRKYKKGDAFLVVPQAWQEDEAAEAYGFDTIEGYTLIGQAGEVLAVFGYRDVGYGTAECFMLASENVRYRLLELIRFLQIEIPRIMRLKNIRRVIMTVKDGFKAGSKMAGMLEFRAADFLPFFYSGNNYQLFERILK